MKLSARDYISKLRNTNIENELAQQLRNEPEEDRFVFIEELLKVPQLSVRLAGLDLLKRCLTDKILLERILETGLKQADISEIKYWLTALTPKLGAKRVHAIACQLHEENKVFYWLPVVS